MKLTTLHAKVFALGTLILASTYSVNAQNNVPIEQGPYEANWESLKQWECPEWYRDAKFGIWAHWGPQCQAEDGDWYACHLYDKDHKQGKFHREHFGDPSVYGLKELCRDWKAEHWNPDALVKLYKEAGAQFSSPWVSIMTTSTSGTRLTRSGTRSISVRIATSCADGLMLVRNMVCRWVSASTAVTLGRGWR